jgi:hypothetical protein
MVARAIEIANNLSVMKIESVSLWTLRDSFEWASGYWGGNFGTFDRYGRPKPPSRKAPEGINQTEITMHRELHRQLEAARALVNRLEARGLHSDATLYRQKITEIEKFQAEHGGAYLRNRAMHTLLGKLLQRNNPR